MYKIVNVLKKNFYFKKKKISFDIYFFKKYYIYILNIIVFKVIKINILI